MTNIFPLKLQSTTATQENSLLQLSQSCLQNEHDAINYHWPALEEAGCGRARREHTSVCSSPASSGVSPRTMNPKRSLPADEAPIPPAKQSKAEHPEEFSNTVKKRLATSTRIGQACDRCKVRKIRCDGLPGGCSPCLQNSTECFTTDRITGRATSRGYTEELEQHVRELQHRNQDLEQRLRTVADPQRSNEYREVEISAHSIQQPTWDPTTSSYLPQNELSAVQIAQHASNGRTVSGTDGYPTISHGNPSLISFKGTSLSLLGMKVDVAEFPSDDMDELSGKPPPHNFLYNKSYLSILQSIFKSNPRLERIELPPKSEALSYVEWYFKTLNPYQPVLYKPTVSRALHQMYDDSASPTSTAQEVMVHMIFSIMLYKYSARSSDDPENAAQLNHRSNMHFHYCLSLFHQLYLSRSFQACQALTLICVHMKSFPKPSASWVIIDKTMSLALELGFHRSPKKWPTKSSHSLLNSEMRKRVFWVLFGLHVTLSGKLGRPMRLRMEDIDCEIPEPIDDESLEKGLNRPTSECKHMIGIEAIKLVPLFLELYNVIYAVRRKHESYISTICTLEAQLRAWKKLLPTKLTKEQEEQGFGLHTQMLQLEFRLLLRHPSVWIRDSDRTFNTESMRICVESSRQMLGVVRKIHRTKSLDTTWCNASTYILAIITTLFAQWDNKGESTLADLAALKEEMDLWLDIIGDVGKMLGDGDRLREAIQTISESALDLMNRNLTQKASFVPSKSRKNMEKLSPSAHRSAVTNTSTTNSLHRQPYDFSLVSQNDKIVSTLMTTETNKNHLTKPFITTAQYPTCPEETPSAITYSPQENPHNYPNYAHPLEPAEGPLLAALAVQGPQSQQHNGSTDWHRTSAHSFGPQIWTSWASQGPETLEQPDCYGANSLVQLGGRSMNN